MRHAPRFEEVDQCARLRNAARIGVDHDDRGVGREQRDLRLFEKVDEAGCVDQDQIDLAARRVREPDARRLCVADALRFEVGGGGAVGDRAAARDGPAMVEDGFRQGRLARVVQADDRKVPPARNVHFNAPASTEGQGAFRVRASVPFALWARARRRTLFERASHGLRVGRGAQLFHLGILMRRQDGRIAAQGVEHADQLARSPLVEQVDLQVELVALGIDLRDAVGGRQDQDRDEQAAERDDALKIRERRRIESRPACVQDDQVAADPKNHEADHEIERQRPADPARHVLDPQLVRRHRIQGTTLQLGDRFDRVLDVAGVGIVHVR